MKKLIAQGAEAKIFSKENSVIKERFQKNYRLPEIDLVLRRSRTRREAKIFQKLKGLKIPCPELFDVDDKEMIISMKFLDGPKLRDVFHEDPEVFCEQIGKYVGLMHANDIIHADLTTSNMILKDDKIHFIDFGLSFFSAKSEDKAVDLHLLDRALESRHFDFYPSCWNAVIKGYKLGNPDAKLVLDRLEQVQLRGRHKKKS